MTWTELHGVAAVSGILTWYTLNWRPIAGDIAALAFSVFLLTLYLACSILAPGSGSLLYRSLSLAGWYLCSASCATVVYRLSPWHPLAKFPGPRLWHMSSMVLSYYSFYGRRHLILDAMHAKYGPFLRIGPDALSINSLSAQHIYSATARMQKAESYRMPGHSKNVALFFRQQNERLHAERRKLWSAMFTSEGLRPIFPILEKRTYELMQCLVRRATDNPTVGVDLTECLLHWSFDFVGDMAFGNTSQLEVMRTGDTDGLIMGAKFALRMIDSIGQTPWLLDIIWRLPVSGAMNRLRALAARMVRTRLTTSETPAYNDLISYLANKVPVSDIEWDAIVAILAGFDNTSVTMALALFFLITEPRYWLTLRQEVESAFPKPDMDMPPNGLAQLPFLEGVIQEALRLGTPYYLPRIVPGGGTCIDGIFIPEGSIVALAAYSQQVDPANFFPDPLNFHPERWLPGAMGPETRANKGAINSFTFGPHACIAKSFAHQEMRYVLARLVTCMDITPVEGFDAKAFREGITNMRTTVLEKKLMVNVKMRHNPRVGFRT